MMFLPLVKADQEKHLIWARASAEEPDKAGEIMDYATGKPAFQKWSAGYSEVTMGKSLGNIRAMHNPRHLAGKVEVIEFNDENKTVDICMKILDPVDWAKAEAGGYTGVSIGGGYANRWQDPARPMFKRYTPRIAEISLVDAPCLTSAVFMEMQKRDGTVEEVQLKGTPRTFAELQPPRTFGEMEKIVGRLVGAAGGSTLGSYGGRLAGAAVGGVIGGRTGAGLGAMAGHAVGGIYGAVKGWHAGKRWEDSKTPKPVAPRKPRATKPAALKQEIVGNLEKVSLAGIGRVAGKIAAAPGKVGEEIGARVGRRHAQNTFNRRFTQGVLHGPDGWNRETPGIARISADHAKGKIEDRYRGAGGLAAYHAIGAAAGTAGGILINRRRAAAQKQEIVGNLEKKFPAGVLSAAARATRDAAGEATVDAFRASPKGAARVAFAQAEREKSALKVRQQRAFKQAIVGNLRKNDPAALLNSLARLTRTGPP